MTNDISQRDPKRSETIKNLMKAFEDAAHNDENGEFWRARELGPLLGYKDYRNFLNAVEKAKVSCAEAGEAVEDHFVDVTKMMRLGKGAEREGEDIELTRFACYLIAQNGDPTKRPEIAAAQTYFAVQTRRQELADMAQAQPPALTEDERRVLLRDELKGHNKSLAGTAKTAGVRKPVDYAVFQNHGYKGLYGGFDMKGIQRRKGLVEKQDILDHMPSTELAANLFRATQTEEKLRRDNIRSKDAANKTHFEVGKRVRQTISEIGGTMPEDYPAVEHVKEARKRIKNTEKKKLD